MDHHLAHQLSALTTQWSALGREGWRLVFILQDELGGLRAETMSNLNAPLLSLPVRDGVDLWSSADDQW